MPLCELLPGQTGILSLLPQDETLRRRLLDLGMIPGTRVKCVLRSPLKDPCAYLVRGTVMALRREDAAQVKVEAPAWG